MAWVLGNALMVQHVCYASQYNVIQISLFEVQSLQEEDTMEEMRETKSCIQRFRPRPPGRHALQPNCIANQPTKPPPKKLRAKDVRVGACKNDCEKMATQRREGEEEEEEERGTKRAGKWEKFLFFLSSFTATRFFNLFHTPFSREKNFDRKTLCCQCTWMRHKIEGRTWQIPQTFFYPRKVAAAPIDLSEQSEGGLPPRKKKVFLIDWGGGKTGPPPPLSNCEKSSGWERGPIRPLLPRRRRRRRTNFGEEIGSRPRFSLLSRGKKNKRKKKKIRREVDGGGPPFHHSIQKASMPLSPINVVITINL